MRVLIILSAVLQLSLCYPYPESVGAFSYQDSTGRRYGGTYGGSAYSGAADPLYTNNFIGAPFGNDFQDIDTFMPNFFRNLEQILQEIMKTSFDPAETRNSAGFAPFKRHIHFRRLRHRTFASDFKSHQLASFAAQRAYDLTANNVYQYSPFLRFPFQNFQGFDSDLQQRFGMSDNSAFASSAIGPGFKHQIAAINPPGPMENINIMSATNPSRKGGNYYGVSSSSYSSSSNLNGKVSNQRGGETIVNDNGMITRYKVEN